MNVELRRITIADLFEAQGFDAVCAAYCAESNRNAALAGSAPDRARYEGLETAGMLAVIGAFQACKLVGLAIILITPVLHFDGKTIATTESIFMLPANRKGGAGADLLVACKDLAKRQGCAGLYVSAPVGGRLERVLPRSGFIETNRIFYSSFAEGSQ